MLLETGPSRVEATLHRTLERALTALERTQVDDHWAGTLSSSALATAMSISALCIADDQTHRAAIARGRAWLTETQHPDGGWGDAIVDSSNINATSLSIAALSLTRPQVSNESAHNSTMERAMRCLKQQFGGFNVVGDPGRCTLSGPCRTLAALAGLMAWGNIKRLRPEVVLLPRRFRRTISTTFPAYLSIATLHSMRAPHPLNSSPTYPVAVHNALEWLATAQGPDGSFEESAFLTSVIIACLVAAGFGHLNWLKPAVDFVRRSQREDGSWPIDRDLEVFDTDLGVFAFGEAAVDVPEAERVRCWLLGRQVQQECFATSAPAGGWPWAMPAGWPDSDDTAYTLLALRCLGVPPDWAAVQQGADWLSWMQDRRGSWSTFVRSSRMPFDHDCPYVTGHALSALQAVGRRENKTSTFDRALAYLARAQRPDGSFASIWFRGGTAGTASVVQALCDIGLPDRWMATRARRWLLANQNDDGGWGGVRGQSSTAEETAWAVMALLASESHDVDNLVRLGVAWLIRNQQSDGTWRPWPIGLYYSAMWYSDSMYALAWPAQALARAARHGLG